MAKISQIQLPNGDTFDLVDEKVTQNASTSNTPQPILFRNNVSTSADSSTEQVRYASAVTITPSTGTINATKFNDYILAGACAKAVDNSISTSSSSTNLPTSAAVASFVEGKGYITSYTETDPIFSASAAAGITSTDISNWNAKVSDDKTWNGVTLNLNGGITGGSLYVPARANKTDTTAYQLSAKTEPTAQALAMYGNNAYLYSTTPSANDNSTKVATTAYIQALLADNITINKEKYLIFDYGNDNPRSVSFSINGSSSSGGNVTNFIGSFDTPVRLGGISTPSNNTDAANKKYVDDSIGALSIPTKTSDLINDSGFITSYTDEKVKAIAIDSTTNTTYQPVISTDTNNAETKLRSDNLKFTIYNASQCWLSIGEGGSSNGKLRLYTTTAGGYTTLQSNATTGRYITFPDAAGTVALTSDIPTVPTKTSDLTNDSGFVTTDEKVKQDSTTNNSELRILLSSSANNQEITDYVYKSGRLTYNPSTGSLFVASGTSGSGNKHAILHYDYLKLWGGSDYQGTYTNNSITANRTYTFPDKDGTVAMTSDIPTVPTNVSAFTNDAGYITSYTETDPVFTASAAYGISSSDITNWNGKSSTDEKLALTRIQSSSADNGTYYPIIANDSLNASIRQYDKIGLIYEASYGTGSTDNPGQAKLILGNNYDNVTGGNKQGILNLYGSTSYKHIIQGAPTADRILILPDKAGTIALTSDISTYSRQTPASGGTTLSLVNTGDMYTWNNKQDMLVSGTNIKTINNTSILGNGNISIQGEPEIFIATYGVTSYADVAAAYNAGKIIYCKYIQTFSEATVDSLFPLICMSNNIIGGDDFIVYNFGTSGNGEAVRITVSELPPYWHLEEMHEIQIIRWTEVVGE